MFNRVDCFVLILIIIGVCFRSFDYLLNRIILNKIYFFDRRKLRRRFFKEENFFRLSKKSF